MTERNLISAKQLMAYVVSSQIGVGIWTITANLAKNTGHDAWMSLLLAGFIFSIIIVVIMLLLKRYYDQTILEISRHLFGNILGTVFNTIILLYLFFFAVFEVRGITEFVGLILMPATPPLILSIVLILPTIYLTWNGLNAVCKFSQVIFSFLALISIMALLLHNKINVNFLLPVGTVEFTKIIKNIPITTFIYLGPEFVAFIYPQIRDRNDSLKWAMSANLLTTLAYTTVFIVAIALFGENLAKGLKLHLFDMPRYFRISGIDRSDFIFVMIWFPLVESALRIFFFTAYHAINSFFRWERNRWRYCLFTAIIIILSRIPRDLNQLFDFSNILSYWGGGVVFYMICCYLLSFIIKRGVKEK
jgi:spore germination protein (amino acid permease)